MTELKLCPFCGGAPEFRKEYIETAFGDKPVFGMQCHDCRARTSFYMADEMIDKETTERLASLWNKECDRWQMKIG